MGQAGLVHDVGDLETVEALTAKAFGRRQQQLFAVGFDGGA